MDKYNQTSLGSNQDILALSSYYPSNTAYIIHFDEGHEVRDISKAFGNVWHEGLLSKLKQASLNERSMTLE